MAMMAGDQVIAPASMNDVGRARTRVEAMIRGGRRTVFKATTIARARLRSWSIVHLISDDGGGAWGRVSEDGRGFGGVCPASVCEWVNLI